MPETGEDICVVTSCQIGVQSSSLRSDRAPSLFAGPHRQSEPEVVDVEELSAYGSYGLAPPGPTCRRRRR